MKNVQYNIFFFIGEAGDDQPFVVGNEKSSEYDPNLYLYSVSYSKSIYLLLLRRQRGRLIELFLFDGSGSILRLSICFIIQGRDRNATESIYICVVIGQLYKYDSGSHRPRRKTTSTCSANGNVDRCIFAVHSEYFRRYIIYSSDLGCGNCRCHFRFSYRPNMLLCGKLIFHLAKKIQWFCAFDNISVDGWHSLIFPFADRQC